MAPACIYLIFTTLALFKSCSTSPVAKYVLASTQCQAGQFNAFGPCRPCTVGNYNPTAGGLCGPCTSGSTTAPPVGLIGAKSASECNIANQGYGFTTIVTAPFQPAAQSIGICGAGSFSPGGLNAVCSSCGSLTPATGITATPGASSCTTCPINSSPNPTFTACLCNIGFIGASSNCQKCPGLSSTTAAGSQTCDTCQRGVTYLYNSKICGAYIGGWVPDPILGVKMCPVGLSTGGSARGTLALPVCSPCDTTENIQSSQIPAYNGNCVVDPITKKPTGNEQPCTYCGASTSTCMNVKVYNTVGSSSCIGCGGQQWRSKAAGNICIRCPDLNAVNCDRNTGYTTRCNSGYKLNDLGNTINSKCI